MKHKLITFLIFLPMLAKAQMTLEHTYSGQQGLINCVIEGDGMKYIAYDTSSRSVVLYNDDHTVWKTVHNVMPINATIFEIQYPSKYLFNSDNFIEFLLSYTVGTNSTMVLLNENGNILQTIPDVYFTRVFTDNNVWKLLAYHSNAYTPSVYSLPGVYSGLLKLVNNANQSSVSPNPTHQTANISYSLPIGQNGFIIVYSAAGNVMNQYAINSQQSNLIIDCSSYQPGAYIYAIETAGNIIERKPFVVD